MERVEIRDGKFPVIVIAPHGPDDTNTAIIARTIAKTINCYAIINNGWLRADKYNYDKEHANCNNMKHCHEDVVADEFLTPILRFKNRIKKSHPCAHIFTIHGIGSDARKADANLAMVVGWGAGSPPSYTCEAWMKNLLIYNIENQGIWHCYEGKPGGKYSGWANNNLNQIFKTWYPDNQAYTMQLEIVRDVRETKIKAETFGNILGSAIETVTNHKSWTQPLTFFTKKF
jgi:hypothetical protein